MNDELRDALGATLDYEQRLAREGIRPHEAQDGLRQLRQAFPALDLQLVWEEEAYDRSVHYDVLLRHDGAGTVSLGYCPDRVLPWPLRGAQRSAERSLLRVNTTVLAVDQVVACLDFIWNESPVMTRLIDACLIQEALARDPVEVSDAELQDAMDAFRRGHGLLTAAQTEAWMDRRSLTHRQLEQFVAAEVEVVRLRARITDGRIAAYFDAHRHDFDTVRIARFHLADEPTAQRLADQIRTGTVDFHAAAERAFLAGAGDEASIHETVRRGDAEPELAAALFIASDGEVVGPVRTERGHAVVRVLERTPATLDDTTGQAIVRLLFEEWLVERRAEARIEWFWGNASRTDAIA